MNKILRIKDSDDKQALWEEIEQLAGQFVLPLQKQIKEAFRLADEEKYEEAAGLCCRILDEDDSKPEIMNLLGQCYFAQGNMAGAAMAFHELVEIAPENAEYHCSLGMAYHRMGEFEEAVKQFKEAGLLEQCRPLFRELIDYISGKNYLRTERTKETLKSAFITWESYRFHDDRKFGNIMDTGLTSIYNIRILSKIYCGWKTEKIYKEMHLFRNGICADMCRNIQKK